MSPTRIAVALYHRDRFSEGHMRRVFGHEAFHWGIMIVPEEGDHQHQQGAHCWTFEATDATEINPVTFRMINPTMVWWLRAKEDVDPELDPKLIGRVVIGQIPHDVSFAELQQLFESVPLPTKNRHPQQSCVTWVGNAIAALQKRGWVGSFAISDFKDWTLTYGDERLKGGEHAKQPKVVHYTE